jgi:putative phosphoribosyl transferase
MMTFEFNQNHLVKIPLADDESLPGILHVPKAARGIVLFVHGSGSSHLSPRNQFVATVLNEAGIATLLFDLLTSAEEKVDNVDRHIRFDIPFLAQRLELATGWLSKQPSVSDLSVAYFGASTGAAGALVAAAVLPGLISAVVSRGGRPDLAGAALPMVQAPTLLIVGGNDHTVIELNQSALDMMRCIKKLIIVTGATHLFEEAGTLDQAALAAKEWFLQYFV